MGIHGQKWEEYFYPETNVLINKFNIKDQNKLQEIESTITFEKLMELNLNPQLIEFNKKSLKDLHKFIFGDIYPFAGQYRKVNMAKQVGGFFNIVFEDSIDKFLDEIFKNVNNRLETCASKYEFSSILAYMYTQLIYCHPFREGNGRTVREFVREFSIVKSKCINESLELDWRLINRDELNEHLRVAHIFPGATALLFNEALVNNNQIHK